MFIGLASQKEKRKPVAAQSEIGNLRRLQLKLQFVSDKGDEFRIRGFDIHSALCYPVFRNCTAVRFGRIDRGKFTYRRGKVSVIKVFAGSGTSDLSA